MRSGIRRRGSAPTRQRLLRAAAELIAEVGWGRVTTRMVAARADLPHGTVSYHFAGKQELLVEAALHVVEQAFPLADVAAMESLEDLITVISAHLDRDAIDPVLSGVMMETMRESAREPVLRERLSALAREYRRLLAGLVRADQERGTVVGGAAPDALATLVVAVGDGLLLHALLDADLNVAGPLDALRGLCLTR